MHSSLLVSLRIYVLPIKFTQDEVARLQEDKIFKHGGRSASSPEEADVILTRLLSRKRLTMILSPELVDSKAVLSERWLHDSIAQSKVLDYREYLLPPDHPEDFDVPPALQQSVSDQRSVSPSPLSSPELQPYRKRTRTATPAQDSSTHPVEASTSGRQFTWAVSDDSSPPPLPDVDNLRLSSRSPLPPYPSLPTPEDYSPFPRAPESLIPRSGGHAIEPSALPNLACKRPSPLYCVNQRLCEELQVILLWKEVGEDDLGGGKGLSDKHALSYKRAISSIKAYPTRLHSVAEAKKLPQVGVKISSQIGEFLEKGRIALSTRLRKSPRLHCLLLFQTLHTVGPYIARDLYDEHRCRTLADVRRKRPSLALEVDFWAELQTKIPRDEVEEIAAAVHAEMEKLRPGSQYTICGGYRRGKTLSGDVDMVVTHPDEAAHVSGEVLEMLIQQMTDSGLVLNTVSGNQIGAGKQVSLEQSFVVFRLPENGKERRLRRRVDIIFAPWEVYWSAVLGWSGSQQFERDLRTHANTLDPALRFDSSGITLLDEARHGRNNGPVKIDPSLGERGVFDRLGLAFLAPGERNADC